MNPEFSVIIAVNNDIIEEDFFRCLSTFSPQEGDVSFEFLVVDEANERRQRIYRDRSLKKRFWKMTPVLLLTLAIWSIGEMCGYSIGSQGPNRSFR